MPRGHEDHRSMFTGDGQGVAALGYLALCIWKYSKSQQMLIAYTGRLLEAASNNEQRR